MRENTQCEDKKMHEGKEKLDFITVLYGLAVLLVLFGHSHPLHTNWPLYMQEATAFVYKFHMPLFFFIAGILIAYTANGRDIWSWWKKKATKLIIPYVILTFIAWIPKCILGSYMTDNMEVSLSNFVRILLIPREGIWGHFWFIPTYLIITLLCAYVYKITKDKPLILRGGGITNWNSIDHIPDSGQMVCNSRYIYRVRVLPAGYVFM